MKRHIAIALAAAAACMHASAQENNPGSASSWQMPHQPGFWRYASVSAASNPFDRPPGRRRCDPWVRRRTKGQVVERREGQVGRRMI